MEKKKEKHSMEQIIDKLVNDLQEETIEKQLLRPKLIRELYKQLGDPTQEDFPEIYETAGGGWKREKGYTTFFFREPVEEMKRFCNQPTDWRIKKPSQTKLEIVDRYSRAGWYCRVEAYNVACVKYAKHPRYDKIWVHFYSGRDCNKYYYVIERED